VRALTLALVTPLALAALAACAEGGDDALPNFDPDAGRVDAALGDAAHAAHTPDGTAPADTGADQGAQPGDDSGSEASTGDDSSVDSGTDTGHTGTDGGKDTGVDAPLPPDASEGGTVAQKPVAGEVLISEVMFDPSTAQPDTEWFEVYNAASGPRDLGGLTLADGSGRTEVVAGSVVLPAGAYVVLANSLGTTVPPSAVAYKYTALRLANSTTGAVSLQDGSTVLASVAYGGFSSAILLKGASVQLKNLTLPSEATSSSWCSGANTWSGSTDFGTPGAKSDCP
jgi:hypothetical protein